MYRNQIISYILSWYKSPLYLTWSISYVVKWFVFIAIILSISTSNLPEMFAQQVASNVRIAVAKNGKKYRVITLDQPLQSFGINHNTTIRRSMVQKQTKAIKNFAISGSLYNGSGSCIWDMDRMSRTGLELYTGVLNTNMRTGSWSGFVTGMSLPYATGILLPKNIVTSGNYLVMRRCSWLSGQIVYPTDKEYLKGLKFVSGDISMLPKIFTGVSLKSVQKIFGRSIGTGVHFAFEGTGVRRMDWGGTSINEKSNVNSASSMSVITSKKDFISQINQGSIILQKQTTARSRFGGGYNKIQFLRNLEYRSTKDRVRASIVNETSMYTSEGQDIQTDNFVLQKVDVRPLSKRGDVFEPGSSLVFEFGTPGDHLIFTKPVMITMESDYPDGTEVALSVQHAGQDRTTQGLSNDSATQCNSDGSASIPGSTTTVQGGQIIFYTCGASTFAVNYTGGPFVNNYVDGGTKDYPVLVQTGVSFPTGTTIADVNVLINFRPIDNESPTGPWGISNCYPGEKFFQLIHPDGTIIALANAGTYTTPNTNCPQAQIHYDQQASTAIVGGIWNLTGQLRRPVGNLNILNGKSPFGTWRLRMGDSARTDGIILYGFTINISNTGLIQTGDIIPPVISGPSLSGTYSSLSIPYNLTVRENLALTGAGFASGVRVNIAGSGTCTLLSVPQYVTNNSGVTAITIVSSSGSASFSGCFLMIRDRAGFQSNFLPLGTFSISAPVGNVCISAPATLLLSSISSASSSTIEYQFDYFSVEDTRSSNNGYYTTLSMSSLTSQDGGLISNTLFQRRGDTLTTLSGSSNVRVVVATGMQSYLTANTTVTFIKRDAAINSGLTGVYGSKLWLKATIPSYQSVGLYTGIITYTLYQN